MKKGMTIWFATAAFAGLGIALSSAGTVIAQPPGRGPGTPSLGGPGPGGPPNVAEMFSRMDRNNDGKLTKDEVPGPVWERLSNADTNGDGGVTKDEAAKIMANRRPEGARPDSGRPDGPRPDGPRPDGPRPDGPRPDAGRPDSARPDGGRPDAKPNARPREEQSRGRDTRPPMDQPQGESPRGETRGPRDAGPERGQPQPSRSPNQPDRGRSGPPDNAHRGPQSFGPDAFFDRLDKNHDGNLSRDEFKVLAQLHHGPQASGRPQSPNNYRGPSGPPTAHRGPDMRGGGPPWARNDRDNSHQPQQFQGGPPWARSGDAPQVNSRFAGPSWAQSSHGWHGPRDGASHQAPRRHDADSREHDSRESRSHEKERSRSRHPDPRHRSEATSPRSGESPSDNAITASSVATLPL